MLSSTINTRLLPFLFPTYWLSSHILAAVISLDIKLLLFIPLLPSCWWFSLDISGCWILTFLLLVFVSSVRERESCFHHVLMSLLDLLISHLSLVLVHNLYVMCCAIWYHLYNLKTVKNTHGGVLILVGFSLQLY